MKYLVAYPATLQLTLKRSKHEFKLPRDAAGFVEANIKKTGEALGATGSDVMPALEE